MFQVLGISSLGVWLSDREGKMGRGINKACMWGKEVCGPHTVVPKIGEDSVVGVDELV